MGQLYIELVGLLLFSSQQGRLALRIKYAIDINKINGT